LICALILFADGAVFSQSLHKTNSGTLSANTHTLNTPDVLSQDLLVKDSPAKEIVLPGVMKIPGVSAQMIDPSRGQVVELTSGGSSSVYVSAGDINLIQLPFPRPVITSTDDLEIKQSGSNIYFQFKPGVPKPVQLFVENQGGSSAVLSLQLIPKKIVSQVIKVLDNTPSVQGINSENLSSDYVKQIQQLMETVANQQSPAGYTKISLNHVSPIVLNGLVIVPVARMSGLNKEIYVYEAHNPSPATATLSEREFDGEQVLAVSLFPTPVIRRGEKTRIIVLAKKQVPKGRVNE
jgi:conjugal transfer pilus assembly protein TraK